eukprot:TRINITY_DN12917_c0_g1_i2.p1 TRINITY_DN12917_c0_g1~~TRINITY_DN12917_c0_g1_i2.p1  ORF type:complete len:299 (+),score=76.50 TRINITY_DN12917_c0_g1_i2:66-899(+)
MGQAQGTPPPALPQPQPDAAPAAGRTGQPAAAPAAAAPRGAPFPPPPAADEDEPQALTWFQKIYGQLGISSPLHPGAPESARGRQELGLNRPQPPKPDCHLDPNVEADWDQRADDILDRMLYQCKQMKRLPAPGMLMELARAEDARYLDLLGHKLRYRQWLRDESIKGTNEEFISERVLVLGPKHSALPGGEVLLTLPFSCEQTPISQSGMITQPSWQKIWLAIRRQFFEDHGHTNHFAPAGFWQFMFNQPNPRAQDDGWTIRPPAPTVEHGGEEQR